MRSQLLIYRSAGWAAAGPVGTPIDGRSAMPTAALSALSVSTAIGVKL